MKASHGCIRIQRRANAQGQNMQWLWNNLENKTKVFIWDDRGRQMYGAGAAGQRLAALPETRTAEAITTLTRTAPGVKSKFCR